MKTTLPDNEQALEVIKRNGPSSVSDIAAAMGVTTEGARFHLLRLENNGLIKSESVSQGRGRPKQIWSLTKHGHDRFPNTHEELNANIIQMMRDTLGEDAVDKVVERHQQTLKERYSREIDPTDDLENRIKKLVEIRSREGYMADYHKKPDHFLFIENHCPICSAAKACQGFCKAEETTFNQILGTNVSVERVEHILDGARRCCYRITEH